MVEIVEPYGQYTCAGNCGYGKLSCQCKPHKYWAEKKGIEFLFNSTKKSVKQIHIPLLQGNGEPQHE